MMADPNLSIGRWAVMPGYSGRLSASKYDLVKIAEVTAKLVKGYCGSQLRQVPKAGVLATFESKDEALKLLSKIAGLRGERDRRRNAADEAAARALDDLLGNITP